VYRIKNGVIFQKCDACGSKEMVDMSHKLTTFILNTHKKAAEDSKEKKKKDRKKDKDKEKGEEGTEDKKEKKEKVGQWWGCGGVGRVRRVLSLLWSCACMLCWRVPSRPLA
jgi:hypothetical protein